MVPPHCADKLTKAMLLMWGGSFRCIVWRNQEPPSNLPSGKYPLPSLSGQGKLRVTPSYTGDEEVVLNWKATDSTKPCLETDHLYTSKNITYVLLLSLEESFALSNPHTRDINNLSRT